MIKTTRKSAVLYDFMQVPGGAERVTLALCEYFDSMDLVTAFVDPVAFPAPSLQMPRLKTLTSPTSIAGWHLLKSARAFERSTDFLKNYDSLIFSGSVAPLAIKNSPAARNIYYCHTPPRFLYDLRDYYLETATVLQKPVLKALMRYLQPRYEDAIGRMDKVFANSKNVQTRLKKYLNVESEVLYPPCDTEGFEWMGDGDYFLSTARLETLKRVDLIIEAFKKMPNKKLIVTSGGSQLASLKNIAFGAKNITFTGWVSDRELRRLVGNCIATIYIPKDEDFGISPVQSLAAGKPVIGVNEGGVAETVREPTDGILVSNSPSAEGVREAVRVIETLNCSAFRPEASRLHFRQAFMDGLTRSLE